MCLADVWWKENAFIGLTDVYSMFWWEKLNLNITFFFFFFLNPQGNLTGNFCRQTLCPEQSSAKDIWTKLHKYGKTMFIGKIVWICKISPPFHFIREKTPPSCLFSAMSPDKLRSSFRRSSKKVPVAAVRESRCGAATSQTVSVTSGFLITRNIRTALS